MGLGKFRNAKHGPPTKANLDMEAVVCTLCYKEYANKGWQERWFVLDNGILSYYKSQDDVSNGCKGSVKLSVCDIVVHHTDNTRLDLIIPGEQHYYIKATNAKERQQWLVALGSTKASTGKDNENKETELHDLLKSKRSELRLYCDLLMQQIHSVKTAVPANDVPNMETLNQATSLLSPTCDTFIRTLEECMQIVQASVPFEGPQSPITDATTPLSPHKHSNKKGKQYQRQNSSDRISVSQRSRSSSVTSNDFTPISRQNSRHRTGSEASGSDLSFNNHAIPEHGQPLQISPSYTKADGHVQYHSDSQQYFQKTNSQTGSTIDQRNALNKNNNGETSLQSCKTSSSMPKTGSISDQRSEECMYKSYETIQQFSQRGSIIQNGLGVEEPVSGDETDIFLDPIETRLPTFFSEMKPSFADLQLTDDAGIPVAPFLDACRSLVPIFDKLNSTAFAPVKMDFQGNIRKVKTKYSLHPEQFTTLQSIILHEIAAKQQFLPNSASMALLWMKRGLEFIIGFLDEIKNGEENLSTAASNAYSISLKPYHSWVVRGVFAVAVKALPYRKDFVALLNASDQPADSDLFKSTLIQDIESYILAVNIYIRILNDFITKNHLNTEEQI